jgi:hypothetical protein
MKKILLIVVVVLVVGIASLLAYVTLAMPNVGEAENLKIKVTPQMLERGKYLVENVSACMDCHSKRDFSKWAAPVIAESRGGGGEAWTEEMGLPGNIYSRNITPFAIGDWTDGELFRALTTGVSKDGSALFPLMPYHNYGKADRNDIISIIAYLRTISSNKNVPPKTELNFPMNLIVNLIPQKAEFKERPDESNKVAYGKYLVQMASCADCHTPMEKGEFIKGKEFAGGMEFSFPDGSKVHSANITPSKNTGIGNFSEEQFVSLFKTYSDSNYVIRDLEKGEVNTVMPWLVFSHIKDSDLRAIYSYLRTLKPIENKIKVFEKKKEG